MGQYKRFLEDYWYAVIDAHFDSMEECLQRELDVYGSMSAESKRDLWLDVLVQHGNELLDEAVSKGVTVIDPLVLARATPGIDVVDLIIDHVEAKGVDAYV